MKDFNQGKRVLLDLSEGLEGSGREIVADNFFISGEAADELYEKKLYLTGTVRASRRDMPKEFLPDKSRELHSRIIAHDGVKTLTSYVCRKNRAVVFMSTNPDLAEGSPSTNSTMPIVNAHYNSKKVGVDMLDKVTKEYSVSKPTKRWPMALLYTLLEMAMHNAYVLFTTKYPNWEQNNRRRKELFLKELACRLSEKNVQRRLKEAKAGGVQNDIKEEMRKFLDNVRNLSDNFSIVEKCVSCHVDEGLVVCVKCERFACPKHTKSKRCFTCKVCLGWELTKRDAAGETICQYCLKKTRKSKIVCGKCKICVCTDHRVETMEVVCSECA